LIVTSGEDKTMKIWSLLTRSLKISITVKSIPRALDWSPDGKYIASGNDKCELIIYDSNLKEVSYGVTEFSSTSGARISEVRFDPKSELICIGAIRGPAAVEVVGVRTSSKADGTESVSLIKLAFIQTMSVGGITRMDWSVDSIYIVTNTNQGELKYLNYIKGSVANPSTVKDVPWATWTCPLGYSTLGVFPHAPGFDVDAVCRSNSENLIATGDRFEMVNLFQHPAILEKSGCKKYLGHSTGVNRLRFCLNDNCLVSVSGKDQTIIIWETDFGLINPYKREFLSKASGMDQQK
jgi:echinoderm microtubule-associated protein-like 1/2